MMYFWSGVGNGYSRNGVYVEVSGPAKDCCKIFVQYRYMRYTPLMNQRISTYIRR